MNATLLFVVTIFSVVSPAVATGQGTGRGVSVQGAIGTHYLDGGDTQSLALGFSFNKRFGVFVNAERSDVPTDVRFYTTADGHGYAATRGAITKFISGEFRYTPITYKRLAPYVIGSIGLGASRPNVNEFFPDPATHTVTLAGPGFGLRVLLTDHLSAFADLRFLLQSRPGEPDAGGFAPIRSGLAWRF